MAQASIGTRVPRIDGREKAIGASQYLADIKLPGMLQVRFVKSPLAHARVISIDTSAAEALPGVVAVITHADVPDTRVGEVVMDQRLFAKEKVRYVGDIVAGVAAEDLETKSCLPFSQSKKRWIPMPRFSMRSTHHTRLFRRLQMTTKP